jgi:hypothetical protein
VSGLGAALDELDPAFAGWLEQPGTTVERRPARFLRRYGLYRIVRRLRHRPVGVHVAWAPGAPAHLLTGQPDQFVAAALADGVALDAPGAAEAYAVALQETTAPAGELVYVVHRAADVRCHEQLDAAEQERMTDFLAAYAHRIAPPAARRDGDGWLVELYAMRQRTLERVVVALTRFGAAEVTVVPLEHDLPAAFASRA